MSIAESEVEIEKAYSAFLSAYKKDLMKAEYGWKNAFNASRECNMSLKSLSRTAEYMKNNFKNTYEDNVNKFLYVYFKNKPDEINEEIIEICKVAVRQRIFSDIEKIFN
ncbi:hypothetical protein KLP99_001623 [Listeria monocytogenes]|nr:hypothetical protein [Listeria monocytogenes]